MSAALWCVVPAAGRGTRMGVDCPKQYLPLAGRPLIAHTLERLAAHPRIAGLMVVLGAQDGHWPGTTVLHEGFCNFNAGTLGASMVEGRISAGVIVDDGTDIGGGASIMGTMSGGGKQVVSIGKRCLLGANSGLGISLGDDCVVEAGCYVTAGTRVLTPEGAVVKAVALAGQHGLLFRRNSQTGAVETLVRTAAWGTLNPALHTGH